MFDGSKSGLDSDRRIDAILEVAKDRNPHPTGFLQGGEKDGRAYEADLDEVSAFLLWPPRRTPS